MGTDPVDKGHQQNVREPCLRFQFHYRGSGLVLETIIETPPSKACNNYINNFYGWTSWDWMNKENIQNAEISKSDYSEEQK
jgi:hypothetical protein